jgi:hypothetical protein
MVAPDSTVEHDPGCSFKVPSHAAATCEASNMTATLAKAAASDVIVLCLGEEQGTEKPFDIDSLDIHQGQKDLIKALNALGKPIVLVLIAGRPRFLDGIHRLPSVIGVVHGLVPGPEGGLAIAEVLFGTTNPSGRMPLTYPATMATLHYPHWHAVTSQCVGSTVHLSANTQSCPVDFTFGQGLSYSTYTYTNLTIDTPSLTLDATGTGAMLDFSVKLVASNTGSRPGNHTVLLYMIQPFRRVTPEANRLIGFDKVAIGAGSAREVRFSLSSKSLSYIGVDMERVVETGEYYLALGDSRYGNPGTDTEACIKSGQCVKLTVGASPLCEAARNGMGPCQIPVKPKGSSEAPPACSAGGAPVDTTGKLVIPHWAFMILLLVAGVTGALGVSVLPLLSEGSAPAQGGAHIELDEAEGEPSFEQVASKESALGV